PFLQPPDAAGHDDRGFAEAELAHQLAEREHARERIFRLRRVLAVGEAVVAAGEPRVFVNDGAEQFRRLGVGALPQGTERARGRYDRVVVDVEFRGDVGEPVRHAGAAGDALDQAPGTLQHAVDDALGPAHLPEDVGVDAPTRATDVAGALRLLDAALDA